jgi:hypothetical protein
MVNKLTACRCCLTSVKSDVELYEFTSEVSVDEVVSVEPQNFVRISDVWRSVTNSVDYDHYEDSSRICSQCLGDLKFCYMFQKKCLESDRVFVNLPDGEWISRFRNFSWMSLSYRAFREGGSGDETGRS